MSIDIKKLEAYIDENYDGSDTPVSERQNLFSQKNPLVDFARAISGRKSLNPMSGISPLSHPSFKNVEKKLKTSSYEDFISRLMYISMRKI